MGTVRTPDGGQAIELEVTSPGNCLLVVSANWTSRHQASFRLDGVEAPRALATWPLYGTLIGVGVPPGRGQLRLEPIVEAPGQRGPPSSRRERGSWPLPP